MGSISFYYLDLTVSLDALMMMVLAMELVDCQTDEFVDSLNELVHTMLCAFICARVLACSKSYPVDSATVDYYLRLLLQSPADSSSRK